MLACVCVCVCIRVDMPCILCLPVNMYVEVMLFGNCKQAENVRNKRLKKQTCGGRRVLCMRTLRMVVIGSTQLTNSITNKPTIVSDDNSANWAVNNCFFFFLFFGFWYYCKLFDRKCSATLECNNKIKLVSLIVMQFNRLNCG